MGEWKPVKCTKKLGATTYEEHRKLKSVHESVKQDNVQMADRVKQLQAENVQMREALNGIANRQGATLDGAEAEKALNATPQTARIQKVLEAVSEWEKSIQLMQLADNISDDKMVDTLGGRNNLGAVLSAIRKYQQGGE